MIIDLIQDRQAGAPYNAKQFYNQVMQYFATGSPNAQEIAEAMDNGTNDHVIYQLCRYIADNNYSNHLAVYVDGQDWLN
jgi:uncharacterized protein YabN with tetrapyrrole methylase and pyrophosphatase domain